VHLHPTLTPDFGSKGGPFPKDLQNRKPNWLRDAAKGMARAVEKEWKEFR
jgi:hypothetical protein